MKKFHLIPRTLATLFICVFAFASCSQSREPNPQLMQPQVERVIVNRSAPPPSPFWDVSTVDISHVSPTRKLIALTFDDAPVSSFENLVAVFAEYNLQNPDCQACATVFFNGTYLRSNGAAAISALSVGFELANHSNHHLDLSKIDEETARKEIDTVDEYLSVIDGKEKHLFRPPYGKLGKESKAAIGVPIINWSIDTLDWKGRSEKEIFETVFSQKEDGAIVLMHDGYSQTVQAVKRLLPALKEAGYQVVSVSQMAKAHNCPLKNGSVYTRARDLNK